MEDCQVPSYIFSLMYCSLQPNKVRGLGPDTSPNWPVFPVTRNGENWILGFVINSGLDRCLQRKRLIIVPDCLFLVCCGTLTNLAHYACLTKNWHLNLLTTSPDLKDFWTEASILSLRTLVLTPKVSSLKICYRYNQACLTMQPWCSKWQSSSHSLPLNDLTDFAWTAA